MQHGHGQGDRPGTQDQDQLPAAGGGQTEGDGPRPPGDAEVEGDPLVEAGHAQGRAQGHEQLDQDDQQAVKELLVSGQDRQQQPQGQLGQHQQRAELPQAQPPQVVGDAGDHRLQQGGQDSRDAHEHADLGVGKPPVQQVDAGKGEDDAVTAPIASLQEGVAQGGMAQGDGRHRASSLVGQGQCSGAGGAGDNGAFRSQRPFL